MHKSVAFVTQSLSNGGAEKVVSVLANKLVNLGYKVDIISIKRQNQSNNYYLDKKVQLIELSRSKVTIIEFVKRIFSIRKIIKKNNYDIIVSFTTQKNISLILSALFLKNKIIISERNDPKNDPKNLILRVLRKLLYRFSDGYVFQTEAAKSFFSNQIQNKSIIIANPIANNLPFVVDNKEDIIVMVSRLEKEKNILMGIKAIQNLDKKFNNIKLEIFGSGSQLLRLQKYVSKYGLQDRVTFKGFVSDLHQRISAAKVFVHTSNYEGLSNAVMESVCMGIPTISTNHSPGSVKEIITDNYNGYIVECGNYNELSKKIEYILENPNKAIFLSQNGIKTRDKFSVDRIILKWSNYIESIIYKL